MSEDIDPDPRIFYEPCRKNSGWYVLRHVTHNSRYYSASIEQKSNVLLLRAMLCQNPLWVLPVISYLVRPSLTEAYWTKRVLFVFKISYLCN